MKRGTNVCIGVSVAEMAKRDLEVNACELKRAMASCTVEGKTKNGRRT